MKLALFMAAAMTSSLAFADIRRPNAEIETKTITGRKAQHMMTTMPGISMPGSSLRFYSTNYKVNRATDGLTQVICEAGTDHIKHKTTYRCTIEKSLNGVALPEFHPIIRMG